MIQRLLLWDVDGTLVRAGDLGADVFDRALEDLFGMRPATRVRMSGKTDPQIVLEYLAAFEASGLLAEGSGVGAGAGVGAERAWDELVRSVLAGVEDHLAAAAVAGELAAGGSACAGVPELLETLAGEDRVLSTLVTGNILPNARLKVAAWGLDRWLDLDVGAYGSDHGDRNLLVPLALERVAGAHGVRVDPADAWVIGDTPRDLECARAAGARCLLVGTGRYSAQDLAGLGADAVVDDLTDVAGVVKLLAGDL